MARISLPDSGHGRGLVVHQRRFLGAVPGPWTHCWALMGPLTRPKPTCRVDDTVNMAELSKAGPGLSAFPEGSLTGNARGLMTITCLSWSAQAVITKHHRLGAETAFLPHGLRDTSPRSKCRQMGFPARAVLPGCGWPPPLWILTWWRARVLWSPPLLIRTLTNPIVRSPLS